MKKFIFGIILFYLGYQTFIRYIDIDNQIIIGIILFITGLIFVLTEIYPKMKKWLINDFKN